MTQNLIRTTYHNNIHDTIQNIQYTAHSAIELYIVMDHTKNHQRNTFTISTSHPQYTKPATPTMIFMFMFLVC